MNKSLSHILSLPELLSGGFLSVPHRVPDYHPVDQNDVDTFKKLKELGVKFDVRKVSNDSRSDLFKLIEAKASEGLKL